VTTDKTKVTPPLDKSPKTSTDARTLVSPTKPHTCAEPQRSPKPSTDAVVISESSKYRRSGPSEGPVAEAKAKATPPWKQESPQSKQQKRKQTADRKAQSRVTRRQANEGKHLDVAAVDLFAGLRTVHVAAEGTRANLVLAHAAEKCPFANKIAIKNNIVQTVHTDVCLLDRTWADAFVAEAIRLGAKVILAIGMIFFIDNRSVCCALVKVAAAHGTHNCWPSWQLMCLQLGCRIWIDWVLPEPNPADILPRTGETLYAT
jgi:hypothetical protein